MGLQLIALIHRGGCKVKCNKIGKLKCANLVNSFPKTIIAVLLVKGAWTKYKLHTSWKKVEKYFSWFIIVSIFYITEIMILKGFYMLNIHCKYN